MLSASRWWVQVRHLAAGFGDRKGRPVSRDFGFCRTDIAADHPVPWLGPEARVGQNGIGGLLGELICRLSFIFEAAASGPESDASMV